MTAYTLFSFAFFYHLCDPAHNSPRHPRPDSTSAHSRCCGSNAVLQVQAVLQRRPWKIRLYRWVKTSSTLLSLFLQAYSCTPALPPSFWMEPPALSPGTNNELTVRLAECWMCEICTAREKLLWRGATTSATRSLSDLPPYKVVAKLC